MAFELIPCEFLYVDIEDALESIEISQKAAKYEAIGFEGVWIIPNLGSLVLFIALFPFRFIQLPCLRIFEKRWPRL